MADDVTPDLARAQLDAVEASGALVHSFVDDDGIENFYYVWRPQGAPRAVLQIAHGVGEHAARYVHVAQRFTREGYLVLADDHLGHGATGARQHGRLGVVPIGLGPGGMRAAARNVHRLSTIARDDFARLPLVLLGHSWGSFLAQRVINRHGSDYAAVVLSGTAQRLPWSLYAGDFNKRHARPGGTGYEWLSRDAAVAQRAAADPYMFGGTGLQLFGVRGGLALYGVPSRRIPRELPLLIAIGEDDVVGGPASVAALAKRYRRVGLSDVTVTVYPQARHEILNELNRDEVLGDILEWLDAHIRL